MPRTMNEAKCKNDVREITLHKNDARGIKNAQNGERKYPFPPSDILLAFFPPETNHVGFRMETLSETCSETMFYELKID